MKLRPHLPIQRKRLRNPWPKNHPNRCKAAKVEKLQQSEKDLKPTPGALATRDGAKGRLGGNKQKMAMVILLQQQKSRFIIGVNFIHFSWLFFQSDLTFPTSKIHVKKNNVETSHFFLLKFLATVRLTDGRSVVQCSPASFLSDSESEVGGESNGGLEARWNSRVFLWQELQDHLVASNYFAPDMGRIQNHRFPSSFLR